MARLLPTLLFLSPLLANAKSYGDHSWYPYEQCLQHNFIGGTQLRNQGCIDSICQPPMGDPSSTNSLYCIPKGQTAAACLEYADPNPPFAIHGNDTCSAGSACTHMTDCYNPPPNNFNGYVITSGCCWPSDTGAITAASKAKYAAAPDRSSYGATKHSYEPCRYDFDCLSKGELCQGYLQGLQTDDGDAVQTYNSTYENGPFAGADLNGFCAPVDLPRCGSDGSCPTGFACGNAGAAAGSQVCFPTGDSKVPASYFAAVSAAPATTAAATATPTTKPVTTAAIATTHATTGAATTHAATTTAHPATAAPTTAGATHTSTPVTTGSSHTSAPSTAATAAGNVCGAGLQACGAACYDPAQSGYTCENGQLAQVHDGQTATAAPTTAAAGGDATAAATQVSTTDAATTTDGADSTQAPAATTAAASLRATLAATTAPVTSAPSTATLTGINSDKSKTGAAASMMQHSMLPVMLAAAAMAAAL